MITYHTYINDLIYMSMHPDEEGLSFLQVPYDRDQSPEDQRLMRAVNDIREVMFELNRPCTWLRTELEDYPFCGSSIIDFIKNNKRRGVLQTAIYLSAWRYQLFCELNPEITKGETK